MAGRPPAREGIMAVTDGGGGPDSGLIAVRALAEQDAAPLAALCLANRDHLAPFEPTRST
jgi:hypothetical protein